MMQYAMAWRGTKHISMALYGTVQHGMAWKGMTCYGIAWYRIVKVCSGLRLCCIQCIWLPSLERGGDLMVNVLNARSVDPGSRVGCYILCSCPIHFSVSILCSFPGIEGYIDTEGKDYRIDII